MGNLVEKGLVSTVGVSNFSAAAMEKVHSVLAKRNTDGFESGANQPVGPVDRTNGLLEAARRLNITLIGYSPLAQGILTGRFHDDPSDVQSVTRLRRMSGSIKRKPWRSAPLIGELKKTASAHGVTPGQVALNWMVSFWGDTVVAIPGASSASQAAAAAGAMNFELSPDEIRSIDEASRTLR